jgi:hypothetical protein
MRVPATLAMIIVITSAAYADNLNDEWDSPNPELSQRYRERHAITNQCRVLFRAMFDKMEKQKKKVFLYSQDVNAGADPDHISTQGAMLKAPIFGIPVFDSNSVRN